MMPGKISLSRVGVDGDKNYYLLFTADSSTSEGFTITLCDGKSVWKGCVSEDDLESMADDLKMDQSDFNKQTEKALTRQNMGSFNFVYQTKKSKHGLNFIWKKHVTTENVKFQLGSVPLRESTDSSTCIQDMFDSIIDSTQSMQESITSLESDNERLEAERAMVLKRLDKVVSAKEDLEQDMYSKFVVVVNDKKKKIRALKEELDAIGEGGIPSTSASGDHVSDTRADSPAAIEDDTDREDGHEGKSDSEYDTDKEDQGQATTPPPAKRIKVKKELDTSGGSLILDDDTSSQPTPGARRRRGRKPSNKQTPSRPVIPRASKQDSTTPSTSRGGRPSLTKTPSSTSKNSSDNLDDLLVDF